MSPIFLREFRQSNKCPGCASTKKHGYSMCEFHIAKARVVWRQWQQKRVEKGICCYCHRKSYKGYVRCKTHTIENRIRCKRWIKDHPEHQIQQRIKTMQLLDSGFCRCRAHNPLPEGYRRCLDCRIRHRQYNSKEYKSGQQAR